MRLFLLAVAFVTCVAGCSRGSQAERPQPTYDAAGIAEAALGQYDKNKNGRIEGAELDACPALRAALPAIDKNRDRGLSAGEIKERAERYAALGEVPVTVMVTLDGQPLAEATVTFEPEPFMGASLQTATATTSQEGVSGTFQVDGNAFATLPPGLYRLRVTKGGTNIPARYNTQTTLGREVISDPRQGDATLEIALRSR
jgi:hypothetical protein